MIAKCQIDTVMQKIKESRPYDLYNSLEACDKGLGFILLYLSDCKNDVYARTIAEKMNVSRARIANLLTKLEKRNFIFRQRKETNKKIEIIKLTCLGFERVKEIKNNFCLVIEKIIENLGFDRFIDFLDTASTINSIIYKGK